MRTGKAGSLWIAALPLVARNDDESIILPKTKLDKCNDTRYTREMIRSFKSRALKKLYEKGDPSKIKADHVARVEDILFRLDNAAQVADMDLPGWNLHKLSGRLKGFSAVSVSGNSRIWFRIADGDAFDVDYGDYH